MYKNTKNVIFKILNVAIYTLFWGKFSNFWKCACVKKLTNMMSATISTEITKFTSIIRIPKFERSTRFNRSIKIYPSQQNFQIHQIHHICQIQQICPNHQNHGNSASSEQLQFPNFSVCICDNNIGLRA